MTSFTVNTILEKTVNRDKDFRYMATSDLLSELQKESFKPDSEGEKKICRAILKLLNDSSSDVQGLAVKCLSPLVRKVHDQQVDEIMVELVNQVLKGKEEQRDICSIGLKTVVVEMPASAGQQAVRQLTPRLVSGIKQDTLEVKLECMDILNDLLKRFGSNLKEEESHSCLDALFAQLGSTKAATRKRAISCIASLSAALPDRLLGQLVTSVVEKMKGSGISLDLRRTYIQTLSAISRSGGYRLGKQLELVVPLVLRQCSPSKEGGDPEMVEACLQAFESFLLRCPKEVVTYENDITKTTIHFLKYDPNYADDDEEMEDADDDEEEDMDDNDGDAEYSDDDDVSWKVRRAAAKVLSAIIVSRPHRLAALVPEIAPELISRFKEREENVKMDVFATFNELLVQVGAGRQPDLGADAMAVDGDAVSPAAAALLHEVPRLIKAISRQLKARTVKTRIAAFHTLRQLTSSLPGCLATHAAALVPGVEKAFKDAASNNLRIEALSFMQLALSSHAPCVFQPHVAHLLPIVLTLVNDRYYKITAEALRVCTGFVKVLRPYPPAEDFAFRPLVPPLFSTVKGRLTAQDQDQEVKECAIVCMGTAICHLGDACSSELASTLAIILERLRNEITRVTAVKTFAALATASIDSGLTSPLAGGSGTVLQAVVAELASFLRKSNRPLRQASLSALDTIMSTHGKHLTQSDYDAVLDEMPSLVVEGDMHIAHLALALATTVVNTNAAAVVPKLAEKVQPKALALLQSALLQGQPLRSLLNYFGALVAHGTPPLDFVSLTTQLLALTSSPCALSKHSFEAISQAVAACCTAAPQPAQRAAMVAAFVRQLEPNEPAPKRVFALLCLGEIGAKNDLSSVDGLVDALMAAFAANSEEVKNAASFALGNIAAGNLPHYLPHLLREVNSSTHEYLMLYAIKDMVSSGEAQLGAYAEQMLPCLFAFSEREEEGVRNVAAECLGKLAAVAPAVVLPAIEARLDHPNPSARSVAVNAVRVLISEGGGAAASSASINKFLLALGDTDLKVRRGALLALNCVARNRPQAIRESLPQLLPMLYNETKVKQELVHQVDLGPFKHKVDDGLELRKAAFECMDTLLDTCADSLQLPLFISHLADGLKDEHDIKMLCHSVLYKLASGGANAVVVVGTLDELVEPLRVTVNAKLKDNAVKQQIERHDELVRSAMRAIRALEKMPDAETNLKFDEFVRSALRAGKLAEKYAAVCAEEGAKATDADL